MEGLTERLDVAGSKLSDLKGLHYTDQPRPPPNKNGDGDDKVQTPSVQIKPSLPIELVKLILSHLRDDRHALSQCMRASSEFYEETAPLLYHDMTIFDPVKEEDWFPQAYPDGTIFYGCGDDNDSGHRTVSTKLAVVQFIKHVTVKWSHEHNGFTWGYIWSTKFVGTHIQRFETPLDIDTMRLYIPHRLRTGPWGVYVPRTPPGEEPGYPYLALWQQFRPRKIIRSGLLNQLDADWSDLPLRRLPAGLECLVTHFDCANCHNYRDQYNAYRGCQTLRKLVYIISNAPWNDPVPQAEDDSEENEILRGVWGWWGAGAGREFYERGPIFGLKQLIAECKAAALDLEYQGQIVIVNWKGAGPKIVDSHDILWRLHDRDDTPFNRERLKKIQFITMTEYLSTHDWDKEFSEDEAREWRLSEEGGSDPGDVAMDEPAT